MQPSVLGYCCLGPRRTLVASAMFGPSPTPLDPSRDWGGLLPALLRNPRAELEAGFSRLRDLLSAEGVQSRRMIEIYTRATSGGASSEEIHTANQQMMDLIRLAGMGAFFAVVPGSALLLPLAIATASKLGIRLMPDSWTQRVSKGPPPNLEPPRSHDPHG